MELSCELKLCELLVLGLRGTGEIGCVCSLESVLYEFSVAMEVAMDSAEYVSNKEVEKFGMPHAKQIQLTFGVIPL
jgi:hypothetical protein